MNIAGVVILYNPDKQLIERINTYKAHLQKLYIMDNSEVSNANELKVLIDPFVVYTFSGENKGISKRLNEAARLALEDGYDWLLTMDQDSYFNKGGMDSYLSCIKLHPDFNNVAVFGLEYDTREIKNQNCSLKEVDQVITSGSIVNLALIKKIGGFDESLFIDNVDHEYCYRAKLKGYKVVKAENLLLAHTLGITSYHRSLKNLKLTPRVLHSPVRLYYMVRNFLYMHKKYNANFKTDLQIVKKNLYFSIKNNILYNPKRKDVISYILKGYMDYKQGKMGKLS